VIDMSSLFVKTGIAMLGLAFALGSPADAKSRKHRQQVAGPPVVKVYPREWGGDKFPPGPIVYGNEYLGQDPDPFIRQQIWRDLGAHFEGGGRQYPELIYRRPGRPIP
jgi:hypothetical protein